MTIAMDPERWRTVRTLFEEAADLDEAECAVFLDRSCGDADLRAEVERLLRWHREEQPSSPLTPPSATELGEALVSDDTRGGSPVDDPSEGPRSGTDAPGAVDRGARALPERVGPYTVVRALGAGGMGAVYEATQEHPARRVAVKVLRSGLVGARARARFRDEVDLLARLRHPGIAQVLEAGEHVDEAGETVPWYAMELVPDARTLVAWAQERELGVEARLGLLADVCAAVHHAHLNGVIHRDLKPGNLLVDEEGRVKVIDFGVGRVVERDAAATFQTRAGELIGTLAYMSPEQLSGRSDVRSDVYALGVVLYELLTGRLPHELDGKSLTEVARIVQERTPTPARVHVPDLPVELEWITARALETDPDRRYSSAGELRDELLRFAAHEPVLAGAPSTSYRLRKFVRRHRVGVTFSAVVLALLVGGLYGTIRGLLLAWEAQDDARREARLAEAAADAEALARAEAEQARDVADAARADAEQALEVADEARSAEAVARGLAETTRDAWRGEAARRQLVLDLVIGLFDGIEDTVAGRDVRVADLLDAAVLDMDGAVAADPEVELAFRTALGTIYHRLDLYGDSRAQLERAVELLGDGVAGEGSESDEVRDAARARRLGVMSLLGTVWTLTGRPEEGEALLRETAVHAEAAGRKDHQLAVLDRLASYLMTKGRFGETLEHARTMRTLAVELGDESTELQAVTLLGYAHAGLQQHEQALELMRTAWEGLERLRGEDSDQAVTALFNYTTQLHDMGRLDEAEALYPRAAQRATEVLGADHNLTLTVLNNHAALLIARGNTGAAVERLRRIVEAFDGRGLPPSPEHLVAINNLGQTLTRERELAAAEPVLRRAVAMAEELLAEDDVALIQYRFNLAGCLAWMQRWDQAEPLLLEAHRRLEELLPPDHPVLGMALNTLGDAYEHNGDPGRAAHWRERLAAFGR